MTPTYYAAFTGDHRNVPLARNAVAIFARVCGFSRDEVADIRLAVGEALSNAVEHGASIRSNGFSVRCDFDGEELMIEVRDNGRGFVAERNDDVPAVARGRGFGILLMRRLMDAVNFDRNGTVVRLTRRRAS